MDIAAFDIASAVSRARERLGGDVVRTPLGESPKLSLLTGADVFIKWENRQTTGSFKLRGALSKIRILTPAERAGGVLAASTGNHGLGVAQAARIEGLEAILFLPRSAAPEKVEKLRRTGIEIKLRGASCDQAEKIARREARLCGRTYISPYNDLDVVAGQGTIGLEILEDLPLVADFIVPVGGGGLIAGIAAAVKSRSPGVRVFGAEPAASSFMKASLSAGRLIAIREGKTLADAVAGGIEPGSVTFPLCRRFIDGILTVGENFLVRSIRLIHDLHGETVEPAGALPLAALLKYAPRFAGRAVVLVASGGNIAPARLARILAV